LFYFIAAEMTLQQNIWYMLQQSCKILQHLFYFIADIRTVAKINAA